MDDNGMDDVKAAKKKLALLLSGGITAIIFFGWIFYFTNSAKSELAKSDDPFALFARIKENTGNALNQMAQVAQILEQKVSSTTAAYESTSTQITSSEATTTEDFQEVATTTHS